MQELSLRTTGFILSLLFTIAAYLLILHFDVFHLNVNTTAIIIFSFALIQSLVQLIFFIDVWKEKGSYWNLTIFISTVSIIFVVVYFSIWIMNHLNYNMR